jgi:prevent-host-death family protein
MDYTRHVMDVNVHAAKTQLSKLLDLVEDGEQVVITRHGKAVAQLVPVHLLRRSPLGAMRGEFEMSDGWEKPLTDEEAEAFWSGR